MWLTASIWPVSVSDCGCLSDSHHEHRIVLHETRDLGDGRVFASGSMSLGRQPDLGPFCALASAGPAACPVLAERARRGSADNHAFRAGGNYGWIERQPWLPSRGAVARSRGWRGRSLGMTSAWPGAARPRSARQAEPPSEVAMIDRARVSRSEMLLAETPVILVWATGDTCPACAAPPRAGRATRSRPGRSDLTAAARERDRMAGQDCGNPSATATMIKSVAPASSAAVAPLLNCPRCGLSIRPRARCLAVEAIPALPGPGADPGAA